MKKVIFLVSLLCFLLTGCEGQAQKQMLDLLQENGENQVKEEVTEETVSEVDPQEARYQAYAEKIQEYEAEYGVGSAKRKFDGDVRYLTGLCFLKLVDFDNNGEEELLLVYQTAGEEYMLFGEYTFEVWGFEDGQMKLLDSDELFGFDGGVEVVYLQNTDAGTYLVSGATDSFGYFYYHGYKDEKFGVVRELIWDEDGQGQVNYSVDGQPVTESEFEQEQGKGVLDWKQYYMVQYNYNVSEGEVGIEDVLKQNQETKEILYIENEVQMGQGSLNYKMREESLGFQVGDGTIYYSNTFEYPYFRGDSQVESSLNQHYTEIIERYKNTNRNFEDEYQDELACGVDASYFPYYDNVSCDVVYNENGILSIKENYISWEGGMHPYSEVKGLNYSLLTGEEMNFRDVLEEQNEEEIEDLLGEYFEKTLWKPDYSEIAKLKKSPYTIQKDGIHFYYNTGDAAEKEEVVVPYA